LSNRLNDLQRQRKSRLAILDLYEQASPEARRLVRDMMTIDIDLTESLLEVSPGSVGGGDSKVPGCMTVAEIQREMIRDAGFAIHGAERRLRRLFATIS